MTTFRTLGISRHRIKTDGKGITSLVALAGCPLSCPYCINKELLADHRRPEQVSVQELIERLAIDECYFLYTGGGVTFGGGEPLLQSEAIQEFAGMCPVDWSINIETSLNVPAENLKPLLNGRLSFMVDVKAMQKDIYRSYTGLENIQVLENLKYLTQSLSRDRYVVKVPEIPEYSDGEDVDESVKRLENMGIPRENITTFTYIEN
jgi:pyruvate formate lyase activating enzyme